MGNQISSKKDKLQFLISLKAGKVTIADVQPFRSEVWVEIGKRQYQNEVTGEVLERNALEQYKEEAGTNCLMIIETTINAA